MELEINGYQWEELLPLFGINLEDEKYENDDGYGTLSLEDMRVELRKIYTFYQHDSLQPWALKQSEEDREKLTYIRLFLTKLSAEGSGHFDRDVWKEVSQLPDPLMLRWLIRNLQDAWN